MDPRELAYADWKAGMKYQAIADKYGVSLSAVKSWATRDWKLREVATKGGKKLQPKSGKVATKKTPRTAESSVDKQLADAVEENTELTAQQKDFCLYYSRIKNATQAYLKAYGCSYNAAKTHGNELLQNVTVKAELRRLREIKTAALGDLCGDDVVELHMRIAFADMTDFVEFRGKRVPVVYKGEAVTMENPKTGERVPVTRTVNVVKLKDSAYVDGQIITEVSEGREGAKIKLADRQRSLVFLERYFELNPMDRHRKEYDDRRLALEQKKVETGPQGQGSTSTSEQLVAALTEAYKTRKAAHDDD